VLGEQEPQFARLLATAERAGYSLCVNHAEFQDFKPSVNTCGRWVGLRILHRKKTDAQFRAFVLAGMARAKMQNADEWVTSITTPKLVGGQMRMECADETLLGGALSTDSDSSDGDDTASSESGEESEFDTEEAIKGGTLHPEAPGLVHTLVDEGLGSSSATAASRNMKTRLLKDLHETKDVTGAGLWSFLRASKPFVVSAGKLEGGALIRRKKRAAVKFQRSNGSWVTFPVRKAATVASSDVSFTRSDGTRVTFPTRKTTAKAATSTTAPCAKPTGVSFQRSDGTRVAFPTRKSCSTGAGICGQIDEALRGAGILERKAETEDVLDDAREKLNEEEPIAGAGVKRGRAISGGDLLGHTTAKIAEARAKRLGHAGQAVNGAGWSDFTNWASNAYDNTVGRIPVVGKKLKEVLSTTGPVLALDTIGKAGEHLFTGHGDKIVGDVVDMGKRYMNQRSLASILADGTPLSGIADKATEFAQNAFQIPGIGMSFADAKAAANQALDGDLGGDDDEDTGAGFIGDLRGRGMYGGNARGRASAVAGGPMEPRDFYEDLKPVNIYPERLRYFQKPERWGVTMEARKRDVPPGGFTRYDGSWGVGAAAQGGDGKRPQDPFRDLHRMDESNGYAYTGGAMSGRHQDRGAGLSAYNAKTARILASVISR
jgi:hypothetical protein